MSLRRFRRRGGVIIRNIGNNSTVDDVKLSQTISPKVNYDSYIRDYYNKLDHGGYNYIKFAYNANDAHSFFTNSLINFNNKTAIYMGLDIGDPCIYMIGIIKGTEQSTMYDSVCIHAPFTYNAATGSDFATLSTIIDNMIYTNFYREGYFNSNYNFVFAVKPVTETDISGWRWCERTMIINVNNTLSLNDKSKTILNENAKTFNIQWGKVTEHPKEPYLYYHQQRYIEYLIVDSTGGYPIDCDQSGWITDTSRHELGIVNYVQFE